MPRVILKQVAHQESANSMALALYPDCDAHQVAALLLIASFQESSIPQNSVCVEFLGHHDLVDLAFPQSLNDAQRIFATLTKGFFVN